MAVSSKTLILSLAACALHSVTLVAASSMRGAGSGGRDSGGRPLVAAAWASSREVEESLVDVLATAAFGVKGLGASPDDFDLKAIEQALAPLYRTLPKNSHGRLGHSTVRYALHRYFVNRGGMHVKGLDTKGEHWNVSSPMKVLEAEVPGFAQHLLEQRLPNGFDLRETAVLAATLEHLIHMEDLHRLRAVYEREGLNPEQGASEALTEKVLTTHMVLLPMALNTSVLRKVSRVFLERKMQTERSQEIVAITQTAFAARQRKFATPALSSEQNLSIAEVALVLKDLWEKYGYWENDECKSMQRSLLRMEDKGSGRVKLSDFYSTGNSDGHFYLTESREYLRTIGALDESNPHTPRVIVPNYVGSAANCISSSSMRSVCCILECNSLMGQLEQQIGAPTATPEKVVEVVSSLSSETVKAPRALSERLVRRLHTIAINGRVPLHGRLFAQWMHHAFPRECAQPARAGVASQVTPAEWSLSGRILEELDVNRSVSDLLWLEAQPEARATTDWENLPWSHEEELLGHHHEKSLVGELWALLRGLLVVAGLAAAAVHLNELLGSVSGTTPLSGILPSKKQKV